MQPETLSWVLTPPIQCWEAPNLTQDLALAKNPIWLAYSGTLHTDCTVSAHLCCIFTNSCPCALLSHLHAIGESHHALL